jgi:hypothetical protein
MRYKRQQMACAGTHLFSYAADGAYARAAFYRWAWRFS